MTVENVQHQTLVLVIMDMAAAIVLKVSTRGNENIRKTKKYIKNG